MTIHAFSTDVDDIDQAKPINVASRWSPTASIGRNTIAWDQGIGQGTAVIGLGFNDEVFDSSDADILVVSKRHDSGASSYRIELKVVSQPITADEHEVQKDNHPETGEDRETAWLKGRELLSDAIAEAKEDGFDEPDSEVVINTGKIIGMVEDLMEHHVVESVVTDDGDALTYITDARKNYVMVNCTASNEIGVHFNIKSHQVFNGPNCVPEDFIRPLISSLKDEPATF